MNLKHLIFPIALAIFLINCNMEVIGQQKIINAFVEPSNVLVIAANSDAHEDYGLAFPATYIIKFPSNINSINVLYRYASNVAWNSLEEKTADDFFNGINAFRISLLDTTVFVSLNFSEYTDSIFVKLTNDTLSTIPIIFIGIAKYYDNRKAVVTASADDWSDAFNEKFKRTAAKFESYKLPLSVAIITGNNSPATWNDIQTHLGSGYIEAAAHSRNHPHTEYKNVESEVKGSCNDIITNLDLPAHYRKGTKEYVYTWIAPYGDYTPKTEDMISKSKFLVSRLYTYHDDTVAKWNDDEKMFGATNSTIELGHLPWKNPSGDDGVEDVLVLNNRFDSAYAKKGVYHVMCHPNVIDKDLQNDSYLDAHFSYISGRKDVWYAPLGLLYVYQLMYQNPAYEADKEEPVFIAEKGSLNSGVKNFPNPFSVSTTFLYEVNSPGKVTLTVYDAVGRYIRMLVNETQMPGNYRVQWVPVNIPSGNYFYTISVNGVQSVNKLVYIK